MCHFIECLYFYMYLSPFLFCSDGPREAEAQRGNRKSPGIYSVCHFVSFLLLNESADCLHNDFILWFRRSSLPFPDPDGYEVGVSLFLSVYVLTVWSL